MDVLRSFIAGTGKIALAGDGRHHRGGPAVGTGRYRKYAAGVRLSKDSFRQQSGLLEYQVDVTPALVPTPELFARTLQFLVWLEGVNREANPRS